MVAWEAQANGLPCVFSKSISSETALSDDVVYLSIREPATVASTIVRRKIRKESTTVRIENIDIHGQAKQLEGLYRQRIRRRADEGTG